jgi:hypothetical protein
MRPLQDKEGQDAVLQSFSTAVKRKIHPAIKSVPPTGVKYATQSAPDRLRT